MPRTLPLRLFLFCSLVALVVVPTTAGAAAWFAVAHAQKSRLDDRLAAAVSAVRVFVARPPSESSRARLQARLTALRMNTVVSELGGSGKRPLYTSPGLTAKTPAQKLQAAHTSPAASYTIATSGPYHEVSVQVVYRPLDRTGRWLWASVSALIAAAAALTAIFVLAGRWLIAPLRSLSEAVDRIAGGDTAVESVSNSRVREVSNVTEAVRGMSVALREAERERRFLIGAIAHDLRTPLFALRSYLDGSKRGLGGDDYLARAEEKAAQLEQLIGALFAFTRVEYANEPVHLEPVELGELLVRCVESLRNAAAAKQVRFALDAAGDVYANGDAQLLERVAGNLVENAIRHTRPGGEVRLGCGCDGGEAWFSVADEGEGIPEAALPRLFEPFYRADEARNSASGGAGLGLAIAKRLVEAHGGRITVRNGRGAVFTAYLPVHPLGERATPATVFG